MFLFVTGLVFLPVSIFSGVYLAKYREHYSLRYFGVLYHALFASIVLVLIADDAISFLVSLGDRCRSSSYLLVNFEYEREESSHAGFVMLAMSEAGTIAVAIAFILARRNRRRPGFRQAAICRTDAERRDRLGGFPAVVLRICREGRPGAGQ